MELKFGDLIFVRGTSWLDRAIEWITKSKYSHVAVYVGDGLAIEAQWYRKVGYQALLSYQDKYDVYRYKEPLTSGQQALMLYKMETCIGDGYDLTDIPVLLLRYLFQLKIPWHEYRRHICSMLARDIYKEARLNVPKGNVSPEDLVEWTMFEKVS